MNREIVPVIPQGSMGGSQPQTQTQSQREPVEARNNLISRSFARILDMTSEGPVVGLVTRAGAPITQSKWYGMGVYLNGTAMINAAGKAAFNGVSVSQVFGTQNQPELTGFYAAEETFNIGLDLKYNQPQSVEIVDATTTSVIVAVKVQSLFVQDKKTGDINGTGVEVRVDIILRGGAVALTKNILIIGKTQSEYVKNKEILLPRSSTPDTDFWTIRCTRVTLDSATVVLQNNTALAYITRVVGARLRYPNSAVVGVQFDAQAFNSIPTRAYHMKGRLVKVPSNYYPPTRSYRRRAIDGVIDHLEQPWDGTFWTTWSDNPAWCFYDLCTNTRYGLGDFLQSGQVDKWTLYQVARYCDETVPNPVSGKLEPRYTCNLYLQDRQEAIKVLTDMASIFRGFAYFASGTIVTVHDAPKVPLMQFTNGSVQDGIFIYSSTAKRARHTVVLVRWNDPADFYNAKFEYVSDDDGIAQFGIREVEVTGFGCTRRGQAIRMGKWALASELMETEMVRFVTGLEGLYPKPGDIVKVLDQHRAGTRNGGRLIGIAPDRLSVTLDKAVTLDVGAQYTLTCVLAAGFVPPGVSLPDSTFIGAIRATQLVNRPVTTGAGVAASLAFAEALPDGVLVGSVWSVETPNLKAQLFRVLQVTEQDRNRYEIQGVEHNPGKFLAIDQNLKLEDEQITKLPDFSSVPDPLGFTAVPGYNDTPELVALFILLSWKAPLNSNIRGYIVETRRGAANWDFVAEVTATSYLFAYTDKGSYDFRVFTVNTVGVRSTGVAATVLIDSSTSPVTPPPAVTGLELVGVNGVGQGNDATFEGRDAKFQWRVNSQLRSYDFGEEPTGASGGMDDPYFADFEVSVFEPGNTSRAWYETTKSAFWTFTHDKNAEAFGTARSRFTVVVNARDKYNNAGTSATLTAENPAPAQHGSLVVLTSFKSAFLSWTLPPDRDLATTEIWMAVGLGSVFADAVLLGTVAAPGTSFSYLSLATGQPYRFWLRAIDTFGSHSNIFPGAGSTATPGSIPQSDLDKFATDLTAAFVGTIVLKGDAWSDNAPDPGRIAWNAHKIAFNGALQTIAAGNTPPTHQYVWWRGPVLGNAPDAASPRPVVTPGEAVYRTSATHPMDKGPAGEAPVAGQEFDFIIATNAESLGIHDIAWRGLANALIGTAWIRDAAIESAKIKNLSFDKLTGGRIEGEVLELGAGGGVAGVIQSTNYVPGVSGWRLDGTGFAEVGALQIRDNLAFSAGYYNPAFPTRIFQARPDITCPVITYASGWKNAATAGQPHRQTLIGADGVSRTRQMSLYYGQLVAAPLWNIDSCVPSPLISPLFFGVDVGDFVWSAGQADELIFLARPRRLAQDGLNTFTIEATVRGNWGMSVFYQLGDVPVWLTGSSATDRESMGNRRGPLAPSGVDALGPFNLGAPWKWACTMLDSTGTAGYQTLAMAQRVKIAVPRDKIILFGLAPTNDRGTRDATAGSFNIYNGFFRVTAENAGNILITEDPGAVGDDDGP